MLLNTIITRGLKIAVHVATIRQGERQFKEIYIWKFVKHTATLFLVSGDAVRPGHSWLIYYVHIIHRDTFPCALVVCIRKLLTK